MVDILQLSLPHATWREWLAAELGPERAGRIGVGGYGLLTIHRAANTDDPRRLAELLQGMGAVDLPVVFPAHPRVRKAIESAGLMMPANVLLSAPAPYFAMLGLQRDARMVLTDSGGVQKEAYVLGSALRDATPRNGVAGDPGGRLERAGGQCGDDRGGGASDPVRVAAEGRRSATVTRRRGWWPRWKPLLVGGSGDLAGPDAAAVRAVAGIWDVRRADEAGRAGDGADPGAHLCASGSTGRSSRSGAFSSLVGGILILGSDAAVAFYYYREPDERGRAELLSTWMIFQLGMNTRGGGGALSGRGGDYVAWLRG